MIFQILGDSAICIEKSATVRILSRNCSNSFQPGPKYRNRAIETAWYHHEWIGKQKWVIKLATGQSPVITVTPPVQERSTSKMAIFFFSFVTVLIHMFIVHCAFLVFRFVGDVGGVASDVCFGAVYVYAYPVCRFLIIFLIVGNIHCCCFRCFSRTNFVRIFGRNRPSHRAIRTAAPCGPQRGRCSPARVSWEPQKPPGGVRRHPPSAQGGGPTESSFSLARRPPPCVVFFREQKLQKEVRGTPTSPSPRIEGSPTTPPPLPPFIPITPCPVRPVPPPFSKPYLTLPFLKRRDAPARSFEFVQIFLRGSFVMDFTPATGGGAWIRAWDLSMRTPTTSHPAGGERVNPQHKYVVRNFFLFFHYIWIFWSFI